MPLFMPLFNPTTGGGGNSSGSLVGSTYQASDIALSAGGAVTLDWSAGDFFYKTLDANATFTFRNNINGRAITVSLLNTASNYTVTWPAGIKWYGGNVPVQTIGAKTDIYQFYISNNVTYGAVIQNVS